MGICPLRLPSDSASEAATLPTLLHLPWSHRGWWGGFLGINSATPIIFTDVELRSCDGGRLGNICPRSQLRGCWVETVLNGLLLPWLLQSPPPVSRHCVPVFQRGGRNCRRGLGNRVGEGQGARLWAASSIFPDSCIISQLRLKHILC